MNFKSLIVGVITVTSLLTACEEHVLKVSCDHAVTATVRDLTGLDGCGYIFELTNGTKLEPYRIGYCGTPPLPKEATEDPLFNFQFIDGKQVRIGFEEMPDMTSICMAGKIVKITCIEELITTAE